jgi:hypothetical protein
MILVGQAISNGNLLPHDRIPLAGNYLGGIGEWSVCVAPTRYGLDREP